ncbi:MAG: 5'-nucleotidase C-terminal domain-containing protein, partial [Oscillospiraceae bacterium]|nr:5'-nucleotidase C-terminal domain-containing protein [Oscillospiraceae bacterium]
EVIKKYRTETDRKYKRIITRFADKYTHPCRHQETTLGKLFADAFKESLGLDIMMVGSGSIRGEELGPIVMLEDLTQIFPYNDEVFRIAVTGTQLRKMIKHILRTGALLGVTEFYQYSKGFHIVFDYDAQQLLELSLDGKDVEAEKIYTVGISSFHYKNLPEFFGVTEEEVSENKIPKIVATKSADILEEYFSHRELVKAPEETRLVIKQAAAKRSI